MDGLEHRRLLATVTLDAPTVIYDGNSAGDVVRLVDEGNGYVHFTNNGVQVGVHFAKSQYNRLDVFTDGGNDDVLLNQVANWSMSATINGGSGNDTLRGGPGNDSIRGGPGNDLLTGDAGDDTLHGEGGADTIYGSTGTDTVDYSASTAGVTVTMSSGANDGAANIDGAGTNGAGAAADDVRSDVESIWGSSYGDSLWGNSSENVIMGNGGNDTLAGRGGADLLHGGLGADTAAYPDAEKIKATLRVGAVAGLVAENWPDTMPATNDSFPDNDIEIVTGTLNVDTIDASQVTGAGSYAVTLCGGGGNDRLFGGDGADCLVGGDGDDSLIGANGNDSLMGDDGNDTLIGNAGCDTLVGSTGTDTASYSDRAAVSTHIGNFQSGDEDNAAASVESVIGSPGNDLLDASHSSVTYAVTLDGQGGDDTLRGGSGADSLLGGSGSNTADYSAATSSVALSLSGGTLSVSSDGRGSSDIGYSFSVIIGGAYNDTLNLGTASAAVTLYGGGGDDSLTGGDYEDILYGDGGNDTLSGGAESDIVDGGDGADTAMTDGLDLLLNIENYGPAAPDGLTATEGSGLSVALEWDPVDELTQYVLDRRVNGGSWSLCATLYPDQYTHTDYYVQEARFYEYRLKAVNSVGESGYSDIAGVYTLPAAPTNLVATLGTEDGDVNLSWTDNSTGETGYVIEVAVDGGAWRELTATAANATTCTLTGLQLGSSFSFQVSAKNVSGKSSSTSSTPVTVPGPTWKTYGEASVNGQTITLGVSGKLEGDLQGPKVHGASLLLPPASQYVISASVDLRTWDSYNENQGEGTGTGYWDSFSISLTDAPYDELTLTDPLSFPFIWGGNYYGDGVLESLTSTEYLTLSGDPQNPRYLNVVLDTGTDTDTDSKFPSWGTITITPTLTPYVPPKVSISATKKQTAEGGSEAGQFTVYRDTKDTSQSLTVYLNPSGSATAGTDYQSLPASVTIPVGAKSVTVDVSAFSDTNTAEGHENVVATIATNAAYTTGSPSQATVQIVNANKYLVGFYGLGSKSLMGNEDLREIVLEASSRYGYVSEIFREKDDKAAAEWLLSRLNADTDKSISKPEAEASTVSIIGYSYGGVEAAALAWRLNQVGDRLGGLKITEPVKVYSLVTLDPVPTILFKPVRGDVGSNVASFTNYYQQRAGDSFVTILIGQGPQVLDPAWKVASPGSFFLKGSPIHQGSNAICTAGWRIDVDFATTVTTRIWDGVNYAQLAGGGINHDLVPWWTFDYALADLA